MKAILIAMLLISSVVYAAPVKEGYFPESRIVDAVGCSKHLPARVDFTACITYLICESDIVKNPIGERYGFRIFIPRGSVWEYQVWEADMDDADTKDWCGSFR